MFPNMEQKSKLCLLHVTYIDDPQENDVINQNPVPFGKSNNSKYLEKLPEFRDFKLSDEIT